MKAGDHVGILATNCIEWVEAMFAIYKIRAARRERQLPLRRGGAALPLRELRPRRAASTSASTARSSPRPGDAQPKLQHFFRIEWDDSDADDSALDPIEFEAAIASGSPERDFGERSDDDIYLLYTGGTTGMPKGVMWRQEDVYFALGGGIDVFTNERVTSPHDGEREDRPDGSRRVWSACIDPAAHARRRSVLDLPRDLFEGNTAVIARQVRRRGGVARSSRSTRST